MFRMSRNPAVVTNPVFAPSPVSTALVVIVVPWAMLAVNVLSQFFVNAIGESFIQVLGLVNMAVMGVQVLALYLALSSFDRACIGRHMGRDESNDLPDFLRPYA